MWHARNSGFGIVDLAIGLADTGASRTQQRDEQRRHAERSYSRPAARASARAPRPSCDDRLVAHSISNASQRRHTVGDLPRLTAGPPGIATSPWPAEELPATNVQTMVDVLRFVYDGAV